MHIRLLVCLALVAACDDTSSPMPFPPGADLAGTLPAKADLGTTAPTPDPWAGASGTRLRQQVFQTSDGNTFPNAIIDSQLGVQCVFAVAEDGQVRCLPDNHTDGVDLSGGGSVPYQTGNSACPPAYLVVQPPYDSGTCSQGQSVVYKTGAAVASVCTEWITSGSNSYCAATETENDPGGTFYLIGAKVDPSQFVAATQEAAGNAGRLAVQRWHASDGTLQAFGLHDTMLGVDCAFTAADDSQVRCLPSSTADTFDESGNTSVPAVAGNSACAPEYVVAYPPSAGNGESCQADAMVVYTVGKEETSLCEAWAGTNGGSCTETSTLNAPGGEYFLAGPEAPPSLFLAGALADANATGRVRLQEYQALDGSRQPAGYRDSQLGVACEFLLAEDNQIRCLPTSWAGGVDVSGGGSVPYIESNSACPPPYVVADDSLTHAACQPTHYVVYKLGAQVASVCLSWQSGQCTSTFTSNGVADTYYHAGDKVDPSQFVAATLTTQ